MKESKDNKKPEQQDGLNPSDLEPKSLSQIFKEMPYTDKRGKGFVQSIHKLPEQSGTKELQNDKIGEAKFEDDKIEEENKNVKERKSFLQLKSLNIRPE